MKILRSFWGSRQYAVPLTVQVRLPPKPGPELNPDPRDEDIPQKFHGHARARFAPRRGAETIFRDKDPEGRHVAVQGRSPRVSRPSMAQATAGRSATVSIT